MSVNTTSAPMRILGVDPGLRITGYAVLEVRPNGPHVCEAGIIRTTGKTKKTNKNQVPASPVASPASPMPTPASPAPPATTTRQSAGRVGATNIAGRLRVLYDGIVEVIEEFHPEVMVVEQLFSHYEHPRTAILMAHARGVLLLAGAQYSLKEFGYPATRIKKTITGSGRAPKDQVQRTMQQELHLSCLPEPPDVADALAVALCHYHIWRSRELGLGCKSSSSSSNPPSSEERRP